MDDWLLDLLTIASFLIGLQNLDLNSRQVEGLDAHLREQDRVLREEQNSMLRRIYEQNETIISMLKEIKKCIER